MMLETIKNSYKGISEPTKASLWFVVSNVVIKGISFITLPIFTRLLSVEEYGIINVYSSWVGLVMIIITLTLWGGVLNVGMTKYSGKEDELVSSFQGLAGFITLIVSVIVLVNVKAISMLIKMSPVLIVFMFIDIFVQIPFNIWATRQRYIYKYKKLIVLTGVMAIGNPILGYYMVSNSNYKPEARILSCIIVNFVVGMYAFVDNQIKGKKLYDNEFWRYAVSFSIVLIPYYFSLQVLNQSDRIMIRELCGDGKAGIYGVAYNFAMILSLITNGIVSSLTPYIYKSIKQRETKDLTEKTTGIILLVSVMTLSIICFVPDVFLLLLPDSYDEALYVIPPVVLGAYYMFIYPLFSAVEMYYEENLYITLGSCIAAGVNIIANYIFIRIFGFIAAAYTTLICYMLLAVIHYFLMIKVQRKHRDDTKIYNVKQIAKICCITTVVGLISLLVYDNAIIRWVIILIIAIVVIYKRKWILSNLSIIFNKGGEECS